MRNTYGHRLEHDLTHGVVDAWSLGRIAAYQAIDVAAAYVKGAAMEPAERLRFVILLTYVGLRTVDNPDLKDTGPSWHDRAPNSVESKKRGAK